MRKYYLVSVPLLFLLFGAQSMAEDVSDIKDHETATTMDTIVVTATKTEEKRKDVPNSMVIVDEMDIQETPAETIGGLLANEPGIDWRTYGDYGGAGGEIQIRGMDSDETQVLLNGININSPSLGRANVAIIPMRGLSKIEVVKGAGSLLYGSGAMAGTVNVITKRPERDIIDLSVGGGYGTQNTYEFFAEQGMFVTGDFGYYLTAGSRETDGFRDNSDLEHNDVSLNLVLDKGDKLNVSLYGDYITRDFGVPGIKPPPGTSDFYINGVRFYSSESASTLDRGETDDGHAILKMESKFHESLKLTLQTDYLYNEVNNTIRYNADGWGYFAEEGLRTIITNKVLEAEGYFEIVPVSGMKLLLGTDYQDHDWDTSSIKLDTSGLETGSPTLNSAKLHTHGTYMELQYRPIIQGKIVAGVRHQKHSTFGYENIPHFGLVINPGSNTAIKATHGKFFKAPTPNDLFWPDDGFARGNPDLDPQTGWHSDITIEQSLANNKLFGFLGYFEWDVQDKITWAKNPTFGNKWTPTNLNKSEGNGWETGIEYNPTHSWSFSLSYTYTDAQEETSPGKWRKAQYMARDRYKAKFTWRGDTGLTASLIGRYVSDREYYETTSDLEPTDILESYATVDIRLAQRIKERWLISLDGLNLFDKEYDTYIGTFVDSGGTSTDEPYPGAGRSFFARVAYEF